MSAYVLIETAKINRIDTQLGLIKAHTEPAH